MGDIDFTKVCSECYEPVSQKPEKAHLRIANEVGGFDHARCRDEATMRMRMIFTATDARLKYASRAAGSAVGHSVKVSKDPRPEWICTCGMRGNSTGTSDKGSLRDEGLAHLRSTYALAD